MEVIFPRAFKCLFMIASARASLDELSRFEVFYLSCQQMDNFI